MAHKSRSPGAARSVGELMDDSEAPFGRVLRRARAIERLNHRVSGLLDPDLARHCQVANVRAGRMVFACSSPACATQLRMQAGELLKQLRAFGMEDIEEIVVRVVPRT